MHRARWPSLIQAACQGECAGVRFTASRHASARKAHRHEHLRPGPGQEPCQLRGALTGELRGAQRRGVCRSARGGSWPAARLAAALRGLGVARGTTVSLMLPNTPEMIEAHYAVPGLNAVLHPLNTRLDAALLAWQMQNCEA